MQSFFGITKQVVYMQLKRRAWKPLHQCTHTARRFFIIISNFMFSVLEHSTLEHIRTQTIDLLLFSN